MYQRILFSLPFLFFSVFLHTKCKGLDSIKENRQSQSIYRIARIDSLNNYYLIYAKKDNAYFRIASKKDKCSLASRIKLGKSYHLLLHSFLESASNQKFAAQYVELSGYTIDKYTTIEFDSIKNVYYASNLKGLCLINK